MPPRSGRPSDDPFPARTVVGDRYITLKRLGHGGYGVVYQALQQELETHVVLKFLKREHHAQFDRVQQFKREAHAPGKIRTGVVKCLDYYEDLDGYPCQVLEYIHGPNLRTHLEKEGGTLPYETALQIALQLSRTMQAAHRAGIVHRDLTPGNIMLTDERLPRLIRAKVIDWGIAAWFGEGHTSASAPEGTPPPPYLPPEDANPVRPACDLFTFGVVLYQMLVGQPPDPTSFASTRLALSELSVPLGQYAIPLRKFLAQCLQQSPHDRPSADDARQILEQLAFDEEQRPMREMREQILQATGKIKLLEEQADHQRKRADDENDQATALKARLENSERGHDQTKELLRQREQANAGFAHQNEKLRAELETVNNRLHAADRERESVRSELISAQQTVDALRETGRRSEGRAKELEARLDSLRKESESAREGYHRQRAELAEKLRESDEAARMNRTERERQLSSDVSAYLSRLEQQRAEIDRQKVELTTAIRHVEESEAERTQLRTALLDAQAAVSRAASSRRSMVTGGAGILIGAGLSLAAITVGHPATPVQPTSMGTMAHRSPQDSVDLGVYISLARQPTLPDLATAVAENAVPAQSPVHKPAQWRAVSHSVPGNPLRILDLWADSHAIYAVGEQCTHGCDKIADGSPSRETTRGIVLRSTTRGASWEERQLHSSAAHLYAVRGSPDGTVYVGADGALFRLTSTDTVRVPVAWSTGGGRQVLRDLWVPEQGMVLAVSAAPGGHLFAIQFPEQGEPQIRPTKLPTGDSLQGIDGEGDTIWTAGTGGAVIRASRDLTNARYVGALRGADGTLLSTAAQHETFYKVHVRGASVSLCGALDVSGQVRRGVFYRSQNRGKHWTRTALDMPCYALRELDSGDVLLAGYGKKLVRVSTGQLLQEHPVPLLVESSNTKALWGRSFDDLFVAGWGGLFLHHEPPATMP